MQVAYCSDQCLGFNEDSFWIELPIVDDDAAGIVVSTPPNAEEGEEVNALITLLSVPVAFINATHVIEAGLELQILPTTAYCLEAEAEECLHPQYCTDGCLKEDCYIGSLWDVVGDNFFIFTPGGMNTTISVTLQITKDGVPEPALRGKVTATAKSDDSSYNLKTSESYTWISENDFMQLDGTIMSLGGATDQKVAWVKEGDSASLQLSLSKPAPIPLYLILRANFSSDIQVKGSISHWIGGLEKEWDYFLFIVPAGDATMEVELQTLNTPVDEPRVMGSTIQASLGGASNLCQWLEVFNAITVEEANGQYKSRDGDDWGSGAVNFELLVVDDDVAGLDLQPWSPRASLLPTICHSRNLNENDESRCLQCFDELSETCKDCTCYSREGSESLILDEVGSSLWLHCVLCTCYFTSLV